MTTFFVDPASGNNANAGTSFALRKQTIASCAPAAGDIVKIIASPDPTSLGQTATWTNKSATVTLSSAVTTNIDRCQAAWTPSANVTSSQDTSLYREGGASTSIGFQSAFTTGLAAYSSTGIVTIPAGYTQLSFWIRPNSSLSAGVLRLDLCSDSAGTTAVATCVIPALTSSAWIALTYEFGVALPAAIQSVAITALSDPGTVTINIDNILACKTSTSNDSLSLTSLISKNTGEETWWAIRSINGTTISLDQCPSMSAGSAGRGYYGVTETVTTWKRETLKPPVNTSDTLSTSGTLGNEITVSGGWDMTTMSSQTGQTWIDGQICQGVQLTVSGSFVNLSNYYTCRWSNGFSFTGDSLNVSAIGANNNGNIGISVGSACNNSVFAINSAAANSSVNVQLNGTNLTATYVKNAHSGLLSGVTANATTGARVYVNELQSCNSGGTALALLYTGGTFKNLILNDNALIGLQYQSGMPLNFYGVSASGNTTGVALNSGSSANYRSRIYNLVTTGNSGSAFNTSVSEFGASITLYNASMAEATKINTIQSYTGFTMYSQNEGGTANNHIWRVDGGIVQTDSSITYSGSGYSWKVSPTSTTRDSFYPMEIVVGEVPLNANKLLTFTARVKKNHATNISAKLIIPGGQIAGIPNDVEVTAANNTSWQDLTLTATPTEGGIAIQVILQVWSGTSTTEFVNVDGPLSIAQAT